MSISWAIQSDYRKVISSLWKRSRTLGWFNQHTYALKYGMFAARRKMSWSGPVGNSNLFPSIAVFGCQSNLPCFHYIVAFHFLSQVVSKLFYRRFPVFSVHRGARALSGLQRVNCNFGFSRIFSRGLRAVSPGDGGILYWKPKHDKPSPRTRTPVTGVLPAQVEEIQLFFLPLPPHRASNRDAEPQSYAAVPAPQQV